MNSCCDECIPVAHAAERTGGSGRGLGTMLMLAHASHVIKSK